MAGRVIHVHSAEEWSSHLGKKSFGGSNVVIVDFSAEWCGPCKVVAPMYEALSAQYPGVTFLKVDVDELQDVASSCNVRAMPTFQAYFNGEKVDEVVGGDIPKLKLIVDGLNAKLAASTPGQKLGGGSSVAPAEDDMAARRARALAAAEARARAPA